MKQYGNLSVKDFSYDILPVNRERIFLRNKNVFFAPKYVLFTFYKRF